MGFFEPGVYPDLDIDLYHWENSISKSMILDFYREETPAHFKVLKPKTTREQEFGTVLHLAVLQPEIYKAKVEVIPASVLTKKGDKRGNAWDEYNADAAARKVIPIKEKIRMDVENAVNEIFRPENAPAEELLYGGASEYSFFWREDPMMSFYPSKCRPDHLPGDRTITDLKSADSANRYQWERICELLKYHWSAAITTRGVSDVTEETHVVYNFVVVERTEPYGIMCYFADVGQMALAWAQMESYIESLTWCLINDKWATYPPGRYVMPLKTKHYAIWD